MNDTTPKRPDPFSKPAEEPTNRPDSAPKGPPTPRFSANPALKNPFEPLPSATSTPSSVFDTLMAELKVVRIHNTTLEQQLADEQAGRRADLERMADDRERLLRVLIEVEKRATRAEVLLVLWESGRLKT